jgi:transposase
MSLSQVSLCLSDQHDHGLGVLLPHLAEVVVEKAELAGPRLCIWARARAGQAACPACGRSSVRVHSRYQRRLADAAIGGRPVLIRLAVRRFFCQVPDCPVITFAEQVEGLTSRYARRTPPLAAMLTAVAAALAGRAGARLAALLGLLASRSSLLRLITALPDPAAGLVRVLGVDDFAFRRGHTYGTLLINVETGTPVDLLPDREAGTLAAWLGEHPGAEVICRDRAGAYAEGARTGAPQAIQVADRWHLWHNLAEHVEKAVAAHHRCVREHHAALAPAAAKQAPDAGQAAEQATAAQAGSRARVARTRERYEQVQALKAAGKNVTTVTRELRLAPGTARRYYRAGSVGEVVAALLTGWPSKLDDYKPHLHQRWNEGCTNILQLHREITALGFRGSYATVYAYLAPFKPLACAPPAVPAPPKVRHITGWILRDPATLDHDEQASLTSVRAGCPHLDALASHVTGFAKILTGRHGGRLDTWIAAVDADDQPHLHSFTNGLKRDYQAVVNGLTLPYSSGEVEGNVNRIKMLKRQMYGRAGFDLLRKRVLLTA